MEIYVCYNGGAEGFHIELCDTLGMSLLGLLEKPGDRQWNNAVEGKLKSVIGFQKQIFWLFVHTKSNKYSREKVMGFGGELWVLDWVFLAMMREEDEGKKVGFEWRKKSMFFILFWSLYYRKLLIWFLQWST